MSSPEVEWTLGQLADVVTSVDADYGATLQRVDRDETEILERNVRELTPKLEKACYAGATLADVVSDPIGTEYDHDREAVVGLRVVGLTSEGGEWGHVDPGGTDGVPWHNGSDGLVDRIRTALLAERTWPGAGGPNVSYTHLSLQNEAPQSSDWGDYYRWDVDVVFEGYEEL